MTREQGARGRGDRLAASRSSLILIGITSSILRGVQYSTNIVVSMSRPVEKHLSSCLQLYTSDKRSRDGALPERQTACNGKEISRFLLHGFRGTRDGVSGGGGGRVGCGVLLLASTLVEPGPTSCCRCRYCARLLAIRWYAHAARGLTATSSQSLTWSKSLRTVECLRLCSSLSSRTARRTTVS